MNYKSHVHPVDGLLKTRDFVFERREAPINGERKCSLALWRSQNNINILYRFVILTNTGCKDDVSVEHVVRAPRNAIPDRFFL